MKQFRNKANASICSSVVGRERIALIREVLSPEREAPGPLGSKWRSGTSLGDAGGVIVWACSRIT